MRNFRETACKDGRWMEFARNPVQWRCLLFGGVETLGSATRVLRAVREILYSKPCVHCSIKTHNKL
jgi:hypothetical protein